MEEERARELESETQRKHPEEDNCPIYLFVNQFAFCSLLLSASAGSSLASCFISLADLLPLIPPNLGLAPSGASQAKMLLSSQSLVISFFILLSLRLFLAFGLSLRPSRSKSFKLKTVTKTVLLRIYFPGKDK